jgi:catechol 2,3-dioxygenase-like lactoylglutathione lyase family enzyme
VKALQLGALAGLAFLVCGAMPQAPPRLLGLSHVAFRVSDMQRSRAFYEGFLGYTAVSPMLASQGPQRLLVLVGERQYLELVAGLDPAQDRLDHVALVSDDVRALQARLKWPQSREAGGNPALAGADPEGRGLEIVEHAANGWPRAFESRSSGGRGISARILHAGVLVGDLDAANAFYGLRLGLQETWRGGRDPAVLSWTNMRVPDGEDYLEFMLYGDPPAPDARGTAHHICLEVPDIERAKARLLERPYAKDYGRPLEIRTGVNRRRQLNLYDPDGTRVELMEPFTVDGQAAPRSTAPPPRPGPRR